MDPFLGEYGTTGKIASERDSMNSSDLSLDKYQQTRIVCNATDKDALGMLKEALEQYG
jgi:hypothetical protein